MELLKKILKAKKEQGKKKFTIQDVIDNLRFISKGEAHVSEFYRLCGDVFADEKDFWHDLAAVELEHAEAALRMADLVAKEPKRYKAGRSFDAVSIRLFGLHLSGLVERMRAGKIGKKELLPAAVDIERSVVELNYGDIVETDVPEYLELSRKLSEEAGKHRQLFEDRMEKAQE